MGIRANVLASIETFCRETGMSYDAFGRRALGDNRLVTQIRTGRGTTLTRLEQIEDFMSAERARRRLVAAGKEA